MTSTLPLDIYICMCVYTCTYKYMHIYLYIFAFMYMNIRISVLVIVFLFSFSGACRPAPFFVPGVDGNKKKNPFSFLLPLFKELMRRLSCATHGARRSGSTCSDTPCFSDVFFFFFFLFFFALPLSPPPRSRREDLHALCRAREDLGAFATARAG